MAACDTCGGKGKISKVNLMKARTELVKCEACKGTGFKNEEEQTDGPRRARKICEVYYHQWLVSGKVVSTLHTHICPMIGSSGRMLAKRPNPLSKTGIPRLYIEVINMQTRTKNRKCGIMTKLLELSLMDPKVEYATTSWDDSTADGRNFLLARGWKQEGTELVWRREEVKKDAEPDIKAADDGVVE